MFDLLSCDCRFDNCITEKSINLPVRLKSSAAPLYWNLTLHSRFFFFFTKCLKKVLTHLFLMYIMGASGVEVVPKWRKVLKNYGNVWRIYA
jgi:hypothetical protein